MKDSLLLSESEQKRVIEAIKEAELHTSGEVRVHVEHHCPDADALTRAKLVFAKLGMHKTDLQNGVLFYVAVEDRKFAVIGDAGIDQKVPTDFWNSVFEIVKTHFVQQQYADGLCKGIEQAGQQLKAYFPRQNDDKNELSDDISFG